MILPLTWSLTLIIFFIMLIGYDLYNLKKQCFNGLDYKSFLKLFFTEIFDDFKKINKL